jgi:glycosyltransferase involved in cell wall biosynthesis
MMRVLCLDIEGGHGGSSRSLYNSLSHILDKEVKLEVWCKNFGSIQDKYGAIGIDTKVLQNMPKVSSLPRLSRNVIFLSIFFFIDWPRAKSFRKKLLRESSRFDLIHCNHESLYWMLRWIKKNINIPVTMHKRTNPHDSIFLSYQNSIIDKYSNGIVFITENEMDSFNNSKTYGKVFYNIVSNTGKYESCIKDYRFKICTLANYSFQRGVDQLIDVALKLKSMNYNEVVFIVAGDISLKESLPGKLGKISKNGGDLSDYANKMGVREMFIFLGHVKDPECVVSSCDVLIRPSRDLNPWGRDVLEGMSFGLPIIAAGSYDRFVEDGVTGFLLDEFESQKVSNCIVKLLQNKKKSKQMGETGKKRVQGLCSGPDRALDLVQFWKKVLKQ